jgi:uncharacterized Fe-S cluster-containing MiaB family protein
MLFVVTVVTFYKKEVEVFGLCIEEMRKTFVPLIHLYERDCITFSRHAIDATMALSIKISFWWQNIDSITMAEKLYRMANYILLLSYSCKRL